MKLKENSKQKQRILSSSFHIGNFPPTLQMTNYRTFSFFFFLFLLFWAAPTRATAMLDLSLICNLHHSPQQRQILNPLSDAGIETATSWFLVGIHFHFATTGTR